MEPNAQQRRPPAAESADWTVKIGKNQLTKFLKKRYTPRIATKVAALFSWDQGSKEVKDFYKEVDDIFINNKCDDRDSNTHIMALK